MVNFYLRGVGQNRFSKKKIAQVFHSTQKKISIFAAARKKNKNRDRKGAKMLAKPIFPENFDFETTISRNFDRFRILDKKKSITEIFF